MEIADARARAESFDLDLIEVAPAADPPVVRIGDYAKFSYALARKHKDHRSSHSSTKVVKFGLNISSHDLSTKLGHIRGFLAGR